MRRVHGHRGEVRDLRLPQIEEKGGKDPQTGVLLPRPGIPLGQGPDREPGHGLRAAPGELPGLGRPVDTIKGVLRGRQETRCPHSGHGAGEGRIACERA